MEWALQLKERMLEGYSSKECKTVGLLSDKLHGLLTLLFEYGSMHNFSGRANKVSYLHPTKA